MVGGAALMLRIQRMRGRNRSTGDAHDGQGHTDGLNPRLVNVTLGLVEALQGKAMHLMAPHVEVLWISQEPTVFIERLDLESLTLNQDGSYDFSEFCSPYKKNVTISDEPPSQLMFTPSPSSSASAVI